MKAIESDLQEALRLHKAATLSTRPTHCLQRQDTRGACLHGAHRGEAPSNSLGALSQLAAPVSPGEGAGEGGKKG